MPLPGIEVRVVDADGPLLPAGRARRGRRPRRRTSCAATSTGPEETAQTLRDGWLHTGDVGRFDEDGYLTLVDRIKDMIIRGGENIYPKEIESVLVQPPGGAGGRGRRRARTRSRRGAGRLRRAAIPAPTSPQKTSSSTARATLARYKVPVAVYIVDDLPKNAVGKIDKPALRASLTAARV